MTRVNTVTLVVTMTRVDIVTRVVTVPRVPSPGPGDPDQSGESREAAQHRLRHSLLPGQGRG